MDDHSAISIIMHIGVGVGLILIFLVLGVWLLTKLFLK